MLQLQRPGSPYVVENGGEYATPLQLEARAGLAVAAGIAS